MKVLLLLGLVVTVVLQLAAAAGGHITDGSDANIVAASFGDSDCTEMWLMARPQSLHSGECVYSKPYHFYYTVANPIGNVAEYRYGCKRGCAREHCGFVGNSTFGTCVPVNITIPASADSEDRTIDARSTRDSGGSIRPSDIYGNGTTVTVYASAWRVVSNISMVVELFADAQCAIIRPFGLYYADSAVCTYSNLINSSFMTSYLDERDSPPDLRVAYRYGCNEDCSSCKVYNRTALGDCIAIPLSYAKVLLPRPQERMLPVGELVGIIIGSVGGGLLAILAGLLLCLVLCRVHAKRQTRVYRAIN